MTRRKATLYVTNNSTNTVSAINIANGTLLETIIVGTAPAQVALDPVNGYLYVTSNDSDTVSVSSTVAPT